MIDFISFFQVYVRLKCRWCLLLDSVSSLGNVSRMLTGWRMRQFSVQQKSLSVRLQSLIPESLDHCAQFIR
jgi:hypothetical protein